MRKPALAAIVAAALFLLWQLHEAWSARTFFGDFRAFYCGAAAVVHGANPYAASALYACESAPMPSGFYHAAHGVAVPAPLPGYALLAFAPLALLPYGAACALWLVIIALSLVVGVRALAALLDRPATAAVWALVPGFAIVVIPFGELGSIVIAALLQMALALREHAWRRAAIAGAVAMMLPQIGLPVLIAAFAFVAPMRIRVAVTALVLAALDVAGSTGAALSYVLTVLPAHARAEIPSTVQYGATWMLHALHASDAAALSGGTASYVVMLAFGIAAARIAKERLREDACIVLVPAAFAVFGGTFVHYAHIMAAIPCALLLAARADGTRKYVFGAAVLLLVVPWLWVLSAPLFLMPFAAVCGVCAAVLLNWNARTALRISLASVVLGGSILLAGAHFGAGGAGVAPRTAAASTLAQSDWGRYLRTERAGSGPAWWIAKLPTWSGLLLLTLGCASLAAQRDARESHAAAAPQLG